MNNIKFSTLCSENNVYAACTRIPEIHPIYNDVKSLSKILLRICFIYNTTFFYDENAIFSMQILPRLLHTPSLVVVSLQQDLD